MSLDCPLRKTSQWAGKAAPHCIFLNFSSTIISLSLSHLHCLKGKYFIYVYIELSILTQVDYSKIHPRT